MMPLRLLLLLVFTSSCQSTLATEEELREILELGGGGDADAAAAAAAAVGAPDNVDIDDDVFGAIAVKPEEGDAFYVGRICAKGWGMEEASSIPSINFFLRLSIPSFPPSHQKKNSLGCCCMPPDGLLLRDGLLGRGALLGGGPVPLQ